MWWYSDACWIPKAAAISRVVVAAYPWRQKSSEAVSNSRSVVVL